MINNERLLNTFMEYVKIDSETKNERNMAQRIIEDLGSLGLEAYEDEAGKKLNSNCNNIYFTLAGTNDREPMIFSAHMDTVSPGNGIEPYIDGEYIKSMGNTILGGDDKAGVSAIVEALRTIKENNLPHRPIEIVFSICEEGGVNGAKQIEFCRLKSKKAVVLDSGGSPARLTVHAPGQNRIYAKIIGKPSHAGGRPEAGISAIIVAAEAVANMKLLRIDEETTANIGTFKAIGSTNIVSPLAEIYAEARSRSHEKLKAQTEHMIECLEKAADKYGAMLEYDVEQAYCSFSIDPEDELVSEISSACESIGLSVQKIASGGGSDANIYNKNGIKTINIGNGTDLVHTTDERLCIKDFQDAAEVILKLMVS
jgi:tripeptide aminopeptidase